MKTCAHIPEAEQWAALGSAASLPKTLRAHTTSCAVCADFVAAVELARQLGQTLPALTLSQGSHDSIRSELVARARRGTRDPHNARRIHLGLRLLAAAILASGAATAAWYSSPFTLNQVRMAAGKLAGNSLESPSTSALPLGRVQWRHPIVPEVARSNPLYEFPNPLRLGSLPSTRKSPAPESTSQHLATTDDAGFVQAWTSLREKRPADAAKQFDVLLTSPSLDAARRADILYWSAQSHRQAGEVGVSMRRATQLLNQFPSAPHASDAALILGEYALASDQLERATQYFTQAARSERSVVRERAKRGLREISRKRTP